MDEQPWPGEWLRGVLSLSVLAVVAEGPTYGYAVAQRLAEVGLGAIKGGTLYPVLRRLEADGLVTTAWREGDGGPGRKYVEITARGREELAERSGLWLTFTERAAGLLAPDRTRSGAPS